MKSRANLLGVALLVGVGLVLAALGGLGAALDRSRPKLDRVSGCTIGLAPSAETIVLVDATDSIAVPVEAEIREWFRRLLQTDVRDGERLTLWVLSGSADGALRRRYCRCRPARAVSSLTGNESMAAALSDSVFDLPLTGVLAALPKERDADSTPLLEAVREVCDQPEFVPRGVPRRIILVSDLAQNSGRLSFYGTVPSFAQVRSSAAISSVKADLGGVQVDVLFIPRGRASFALDNGLQDFWRQYFRESGASSVRLRRL